MKLAARHALGGIVLLVATATAAAAAADAPDAPRTALRTGVVVYIEGTPLTEPVIAVSDLRQALLSRLRGAASARGMDLVPQAAVEDLVIRHRARTGNALPPGFLADLRAETGADALLVATLLVRDGRFVLGTRLLDSADGALLHVALAERGISTAPEPDGDGDEAPAATDLPWRSALLGCAREVVPETPLARPVGDVLVLGAVQGTAVDPAVAALATQCLARVMLEAGGRRVLDPALVRGALQEAGLEHAYLDRDGRRLLAERFGAARIVLTDLVSFEGPRAAAQVLTSLDEPARPLTLALPDFAWHLRVVDPSDGVVLAAHDIVADTSDSVGWFGVRRHPTLLLQLEDAARGLWRLVRPQLEEM